jgi:hypothetical protein
VGLVVFRIISERNVAAGDSVQRAPLQSAAYRRDDHRVPSSPDLLGAREGDSVGITN